MESKDKKPNILFKIIDSLFTDKEYINTLTDETVRQSLFMVLRRLSIKYPEQADMFNRPGVNARDVLKFWSDFLYNGKAAPKWIYTSGAVKAKEKKSSGSDITEADIKAYIKHEHISRRDFDDYVRFCYDDIMADVKSYKEFLKM